MKKAFTLSLLIICTGLIFAQQGDTITYRSKCNLDWEDFRSSAPLTDSVNNAYLDLTIVTFTKKVNVWTGIISVESYAGIKRDKSWVKADHKTDELMEYMQLKYDITNHFAKRCENEINNKRINAGNKKRIEKIIQSHLDQLDATLVNLDKETHNGQNLVSVKNWRNNYIKMIKLE